VIERKIRTQFPRTDSLPTQSPRYWAKEKDRYIRQLLISDIEAETGRELAVYFSRLDQAITETDADDFCEVLNGLASTDIDIMLHTPGGLVDAVEKFISVLRHLNLRYRVIVPSFAKSGGTLIALTAHEILMGVNSELGPVDAQMRLKEYGSVPAEFIVGDDTQPPIVQNIAKMNVERAKRLAEKHLRITLAGRNPDPADANALDDTAGFTQAMAKLASPDGYGSHGAVIDFQEARGLGLPVTWMEPSSTLWNKVWLLHNIYDADTKLHDIGKIFEAALYSVAREPLIWD
jgi:hypothetical protein